MGVKLLESRLCLLLLLGFVIMVDKASFQIPRGLTPSQWFAVQHLNMTNPQCTTAMQRVNRYTGRCKGMNTFLHTRFAAVVRVCGRRNTTCRNGLTNCHNSITRERKLESEQQTPEDILCEQSQFLATHHFCNGKERVFQRDYVHAGVGVLTGQTRVSDPLELE
ncbi:eosinophil-associated ribonuclease 15 precursor [Cricetulus griseus]|uniref:Ribonuclease pancreatic n=1 Tax=Cricetulus griseus TaxID=10029 RepID=A0A061IKV4_CRIGR|nr:eosinophil-associated ribonuclease 15 precursor [Cricetulus griseus]